jgi:hypothetical protein
MLKWIVATALGAFAVTLALFGLAPERQPLAAHLAFALGVLPLILGAMTFFVPVLTRTRAAPPGVRALPLLALAGGLVTVYGFFEPAHMAVAHALGALTGLLAALGLLGWMLQRARRALGGAHPGLGWYVAALACLTIALGAVLAMAWFPEQRLALRRLHLHLNTLGFVALTAVGTLQVLLPTVVGRPDPQATRRLRLDLAWAFGGALLIALGAATGRSAPLWAGLILWAVPLARLASAWLQRFRAELFTWHHPAAALGAALLGLGLLFASGALHAAGLLAAPPAVPAFVFAFLLPLVTGALSHLLPLWLRPAAGTRQHAAWRARLARHSALRGLLFLGSGLGVLLGVRGGMLLAVAGLALFVLPVVRRLPAD